MIRRVLLVCSGNTCRSPMAAALLGKLWREANPGWDLVAESAGTAAAAGDAASKHAVAAMSKRGLDLSAHRSRRADDQALVGADLILTMTQRHKEYIAQRWPDLAARVYTVSEYAGADDDVSDPFGGSLEDYEATAVALEAKLKLVVERIRKEGAATE